MDIYYDLHITNSSVILLHSGQYPFESYFLSQNRAWVMMLGQDFIVWPDVGRKPRRVLLLPNWGWRLPEHDNSLLLPGLHRGTLPIWSSFLLTLRPTRQYWHFLWAGHHIWHFYRIIKRQFQNNRKRFSLIW